MTVFEGPGMKVPEYPEPIFNPVKALSVALGIRGVSVVPMLQIEPGGKMGRPGARQFTCTVQEDFPEVADKIAELGKAVRFLEMFVPRRGIIAVQTYQFGDVWVRYVAAYDCPSDQAFGRWDVLVEAIQ